MDSRCQSIKWGWDPNAPAYKRCYPKSINMTTAASSKIRTSSGALSWATYEKSSIRTRNTTINPSNPELMKLGNLGVDYTGFQNVTRDGFTCQRWDSQYPNKHSNVGLKNSENYCRNPGSEKRTIWCYVTDKEQKWDYCNPKVWPPPFITPKP